MKLQVKIVEYHLSLKLNVQYTESNIIGSLPLSFNDRKPSN